MQDRPEASGRPTVAVPYALAVAACTAFALWLVWPAFEPGRIVNLDAPRHLLRAEVMTRQFLPSGHVDGWSPWWFLGAQLFLFQSYGWFLVIGASALALKSIVGLQALFKFWYVLPLVLLPAAAARMARRFGVSTTGAVVTALASLAFSSPLGYGMEGLFAIGLLLQAVGVTGFALAWPELLDALQKPERGPWRAALLVAAVLLAHFISGAYLLAAGGLAAAYFAARSRGVRPLAVHALLGVTVLLLAAHSLFPSFELRELAGTGVGWGSERDRFARLMAGTLFGARPLALAGIAAAAWSLRSGPPALAATALVFFATAVLGGSDPQAWEPGVVSELLRVYVRPRALPYAALMQALFAGVAVDLAVRAASKRMGAGAAKALPLLLVAAVAAVAMPEAAGNRHRVVTESQLKPRSRRVYLDLVNWLKSNVPPPAILAMPRSLVSRRATGARSAVSLLNMDTGLYSLGGDQAELTKSAPRGDRVDLDGFDEGSSHTIRLLREAGVSYVAVSRPEVRELLSGRSDLELVYNDPGRPARDTPEGAGRRRRSRRQGDPGVAVFRVRGGGQWLQGDGVEVLAMQHSPERTTFDVRVGEASGATRKSRGARSATGGDADAGAAREVVAAINWHPDWTATVDGRVVPVHRSRAGRVAFELPADAARVTLEFVRSAREKAWNALSAVALALVVALEGRRLLRRRREPLAND